VADANTMATECCYCGNPTMIPSRFDGELKPDRIIPFQKTKEDAVASLKAFYEGKRLLPDAFRKGNRVEDVQAMYVPFWLFDADVSAEATFRAERVRLGRGVASGKTGTGPDHLGLHRYAADLLDHRFYPAADRSV